MTRQLAATIAEQGLAAVFAADLVRGLREDSPLAAAGLAPADLVAVADAVAGAARERGRSCVLGDEELSGVVTVADLIAVVEGCLGGANA